MYMRTYKPTQPAPLRGGEPVSIEDMVMYFVQKEDKGIEGFRRDESQYEPTNMMREVVVNRKPNLVGRNWGLANIRRYAHAVMP